MDANVKDKVVSQPRAKEIAERPHPTDSLQDLRRKYGGSGISDEEVLLRFFSSKEDVDKMKAAGAGAPLRQRRQSTGEGSGLAAGLTEASNFWISRD